MNKPTPIQQLSPVGPSTLPTHMDIPCTRQLEDQSLEATMSSSTMYSLQKYSLQKVPQLVRLGLAGHTSQEHAINKYYSQLPAPIQQPHANNMQHNQKPATDKTTKCQHHINIINKCKQHTAQHIPATTTTTKCQQYISQPTANIQCCKQMPDTSCSTKLLSVSHRWYNAGGTQDCSTKPGGTLSQMMFVNVMFESLVIASMSFHAHSTS